MSEAADYRRATNEAYELLLSLPSFSLATDVFDVVKQLPDCIAITYQRAVNHYGAILGLDLDRYYNKFGQESRTASPAFFPSHA